jgi:hypothetical protein
MKNSFWWSAVVLALAVAAGCSPSPPPPKPKVVVIGLDGLSWTFLDPLIAAGQLPNFERLLDGAATGELESFRPTRSAILWTSVATGKTMEKHGITDFTFVDEGAMEEIEEVRLVTGMRRTAATIWEILGELGYSVGVVNWWVTHPATPVNGYLVSDRLKAVMNREAVAEEPDLVYPPMLLAELAPMFVSQTRAHRTMRTYDFPRYSRERAEAMYATSPASQNLYERLRSYVGQDRMVKDWSRHLLAKGQPDLFAAIMRITDVFAHFGYRFADRETLERMVPEITVRRLTHSDAAVRERTAALVEELNPVVANAMLPAYKYADDFIGEVLAAIDPSSIVIVVSDHGFAWAGGGYAHTQSRQGYPDAAPPGVIALKGPGISPIRIEGAGLFDIAPTILYALDEAVGRDMDGQALTAVFGGDGAAEARDVKFVATYGTGLRQREVADSPLTESEQEMLEDLRSLGYIR